MGRVPSLVVLTALVLVAAPTSVSANATIGLFRPRLSVSDRSDKPVQPGAPIVIHVGPTRDTPFGAATLNFVFEDIRQSAGPDGHGSRRTYIGTAGHATVALGDRAAAPGSGEFGTVVFRATGVDDFALIRVDADKLDLVSPIIRGVGSAPTGFTTSDETVAGDLLTMHGWGLGFSTVPATRTRPGRLTDDDMESWEAVMPASVNDSGAPVVRTSDGQALGVVLGYGQGGVVGITVERILSVVSLAGFEVRLVS